MSEKPKKTNPVLLNPERFLSQVYVSISDNKSMKIDFDSLLRKFGDGPRKKSDDKYMLDLSKNQLEDEYILDLANTAFEHHQELRDLIDEYRSLQVKINQISNSMDRLVGDCDTHSQWLNSQNGKLGRNFKALVYTVIRHGDLERRKVVLHNSISTRYASELVVDRVTPKRIYVRSVGGESTSHYFWNGTSTFGTSIDIEATFPEGVQEFYIKQQKALKK